MNRLLLGVILIVCSTALVAQTNRYAIFFTDKGGANQQFSIDQPEAFLTQRSLERRAKHGVGVDTSDIPVHNEYVQQVKELGVDVFFTSKWVNAAFIQTDKGNLSAISSLSFVDSIALIAEKDRLSFEQVPVEQRDGFDPPSSVSATTDLQVAMLQADIMYQEGNTGEGMLIAILDDGFVGVDRYTPFKHIWDQNRLIGTRDFVENSGNVFRLGEHGTAVFSTIGAKHLEEFSGTAYDASFILCITEEGGSEDRIEEYNWLLAAEYADSLGADIINSSLGYRSFDIPEHNYGPEDLDGKTAVISKAAQLATDKGMLVVISAGNSGDHNSTRYRYISPPADAVDILTVGSVNPDFSYTAFSSVGPTSDGRIKPDVAALGLGTTIVRGNGSITRGNGTSFASPLVAGLAAGVWQANPTWTNLEVIEALKASGHNADQPDSLIGFGVPNYNYIGNGGKVLNVSDIVEEKILVYPNPFRGEKLFLKMSDTYRGKWQITILDAQGAAVYQDSFKAKPGEKVMEFSLEGIQEGVYFLILQSNEHRKAVKLINF